MNHYPIKQRRRPRTLNPNWTGIAWLEAQVIGTVTPIPGRQGDATGLAFFATPGALRAMKRRSVHVRPMFELVPDRSFSGMPRRYSDPCPVCDDFAYTRPCEDHPDPSVTLLPIEPLRRVL